MLAEAKNDGVVFTPGTHFFALGEGRRFFRLSISRVPVERIEEGVKRLGNVLERRLTRAGGPDGNDEKGRGVREQEPALHI